MRIDYLNKAYPEIRLAMAYCRDTLAGGDSEAAARLADTLYKLHSVLADADEHQIAMLLYWAYTAASSAAAENRSLDARRRWLFIALRLIDATLAVIELVRMEAGLNNG